MKDYIFNQLKKGKDHLRNLDMNVTQDIPGEEVLGIYRNNNGENVSLTDVALHAPSIGRIEYKQIDDVHSVGEATKVCVLVLKLENGESVSLQIDGGNGRYRDAFQMMRFLWKAQWKARKELGLS
jgi:hypothetical protein